VDFRDTLRICLLAVDFEYPFGLRFHYGHLRKNLLIAASPGRVHPSNFEKM
jgi:hypothetical protein